MKEKCESGAARPDRSNVAAYERWWNAGRIALLQRGLGRCRNPVERDSMRAEIDWIERQQAESDKWDREQAKKRRKKATTPKEPSP